MTGRPGALAVAAGAELLERALGYTRGALAHVTPDRLGAATPCDRWRLADLLAHMDDSLLALHGAVATGEVPLTAGPVGPDVVASLRQTGCSLLGRWSALRGDQSISVGGRTLPASVVAVTGALEVAVHGWDVARACGVRAPLPPGLADELLRHARWLIAAEDRGVRFGWPVATPAGCPPGDRLLALTGRQPDWEP